jgi:hypothetical protein
MDKYRILFPLAEPFLISDFGNPREAAKVWSHYVAAIGAKLDIQFDPACLDLSRAYYTPRHPASAPYFVCMGGERPTDLAELPPCQKLKRPARPRTAKRQSSEAAQPLTSFREFLRDRGDEFDVVTWVRSIGWEIRGEEVEDKITILCPNDHAHSNAGDPNDVGCVVMNPPETDIGRAVITCRHGHCHDLKTADFMEMIATELAPADGL